MAGNLPLKKYRSGSIEGVIWANKHVRDDGSEVEFRTATIRRSWKDKEQDVWREEKINLRRTDIPKLAIILHNLQQDLFLTAGEKESDTDE